MNERNVEALAALILDHLPRSDSLRGQEIDTPPPWWIDRCHLVAERLASRGVLVPSALTDDEAARLGDPTGAAWDRPASETGGDFRRKLERIAKGEA